MRFVIFLLVLLVILRLAACAHPVKAAAVADLFNCTHVVCRESR